VIDGAPSNIPNPDPSLATNERLANAIDLLSSRMERNREEAKGWVDTLQELLEEKIRSAAAQTSNLSLLLAETRKILEEKIHGSEDKTANLDRVVQTRLAGSETALNAAMAAADKVVSKIETGVGSIMAEMKTSFSKQIDSLNEKIEDLKKRVFESGGRDSGIGQTASMVIAGLASLAAIASVVIVLTKTG
jgi:hypothetical protein